MKFLKQRRCKMKKRVILFSILWLSANSFVCISQAKAMYRVTNLFTKEFTHASVPKRLIHNSPPVKQEFLYNKVRNQYHYYVESDDSLKLVEQGRFISRNEISQKDVTHRLKKDEDEGLEEDSSYKMPVYKKKIRGKSP